MTYHTTTELLASPFSNPAVTAKGEPRAQIALGTLKTLWFNTGTLCNITCENCYIESSPQNDRLVYLSRDEVDIFRDEVSIQHHATEEIGITGGEPFMNPDILPIMRSCLDRGFKLLVLTNAMRPMMRKTMRAGLERLNAEYGRKLTLRISVDHWSEKLHDEERGTGSFEKTLQGMRWLRDAGIQMTVAGRTVWGESDAASRKGYADLYAKETFDIDATHPGQTVLFPEMDETVEVPEITTACWDILGKPADSPMCASSRMVVKRKGAEAPTVVACTLLAYDRQFEMGSSLKEAEEKVWLNHPHCAKFCVLGGASCSC